MPRTKVKTIYLSGPMRGYKHNNFPMFDKWTKELQELGLDVISPADLDRGFGFTGDMKVTPKQVKGMLQRDIMALIDCDGIVLLPNWIQSEGARMEATVAASLGLTFDEVGIDGTLRPITKTYVYHMLSGDTYYG